MKYKIEKRVLETLPNHRYFKYEKSTPPDDMIGVWFHIFGTLWYDEKPRWYICEWNGTLFNIEECGEGSVIYWTYLINPETGK